jgi:hypothetical protein
MKLSQGSFKAATSRKTGEIECRSKNESDRTPTANQSPFYRM